MTAAQWEVEGLGEPAPADGNGGPPPGAGAPPGPAAAPGAPASALGWTEADVASLKAMIEAPYEKIAGIEGLEYWKLDELDATLMAVSFSTWMPVTWIRGATAGHAPPLVAAAITAGVLLYVHMPRILRWNIEHPDSPIPLPKIPLLSALLAPKGVRRGPTAQARPRAPEPAPAEGVDDQRGPGEEVAAAAADGQPAAEPEAAPDASGFPVGDSLGDVRRAYETR